PYRGMEHAPRVPAREWTATYPSLAFWQDTVIVSLRCGERFLDADGKTPQSRHGVATLGLPVQWFYDRMAPR
ncbi:hypothetical protein LCGC14_3142430, partial [marine sediment metagenome]